MSRVPPARSTRQGASDMIFMRKLYYTAGDIQNPWRAVDGCHRMRFLLAVLILPAAAVAQSQIKTQEAARVAMTASVDKQRASITIQVSSVLGRPAAPVGSFFTSPWVEAPAPD